MVEIDESATLACVSNRVGGPLVGNAIWLGVPLPKLLGLAGVHEEADQVVGRSVDEFTVGFPTEVAPELEIRYGGLVGRTAVRQTGPGRFETEVPIELRPGEAARFRILTESLPEDLADGMDLERAIHLSYPDEYRFLPADEEALAALAAETGGVLAPTAAQVLAANGDRVVRSRALWPLLALLALIAYLLDLSVRRTPWLWTRLFRTARTFLTPKPA